MEYFKFLPTEITLDILTRTPVETVLNCKLVSKSWRSIVRHPSFSKMHFHHLSNHNHDSNSGKLSFVALTDCIKLQYLEYNQNDNELTTPIERKLINHNLPCARPQFIGSCNGLICVSIPSYYIPFLIFNPITREFVKLPLEIDCEKIDEDEEDFFWASGFGYVSSTNEYKAVALAWKTNFYYIYIYTLGSGRGWRKLGTLDRKSSSDIWSEGTYANESIYWRGSESSLVMTLDLAEETLREPLLPPPLPSDCYWHRIGVLDGVLFFAVEMYVSGEECYDIWLLRKKNENHDEIEQGEHQSWVWSKEFTTDETTLFAVTKTGDVLTYINSYLNIYDTKASTLKRLLDIEERILHIFPHENTLVSLEELEEGTKRMEAVDY